MIKPDDFLDDASEGDTCYIPLKSGIVRAEVVCEWDDDEADDIWLFAVGDDRYRPADLEWVSEKKPGGPW